MLSDGCGIQYPYPPLDCYFFMKSIRFIVAIQYIISEFCSLKM